MIPVPVALTELMESPGSFFEGQDLIISVVGEFRRGAIRSLH